MKNTISFNGSHEGAEIRGKQKELTPHEMKVAMNALNESLPEDISLQDKWAIQALIDDYQNARHHRTITIELWTNEYDSLKKKEAMHDELIIGLRKIMNGAMANLDSGKKLDKVYTAIEQLLKQSSTK